MSPVIPRHVSSTTPAVQTDAPSSSEHNVSTENGQHAPPDSAASVDCHAANATATASAQSEPRPRMRFDSDASNDELDAYIDRLTSGGSIDGRADPFELRRVGRYDRLGIWSHLQASKPTGKASVSEPSGHRPDSPSLGPPKLQRLCTLEQLLLDLETEDAPKPLELADDEERRGKPVVLRSMQRDAGAAQHESPAVAQ